MSANICSLCLDPIYFDPLPNDTVIHQGGIQHPFHGRCVEQLPLNDHRCPICRKQVATWLPFAEVDNPPVLFHDWQDPWRVFSADNTASTAAVVKVWNKKR